MTIPSVTYPLDLTGSHPTNLVRGEVHPVYPKTVQAIATTHGPFYVDSLIVVESSTGRRLEKDRDYFATELHAIPTSLSKKDVCSIVVLTDPLIAEFVSLTYQVVGDKYSDSDHALADLLNSIDFDSRSSSWPSLVVKSEDYSVSFRMQGDGNRYGFEYATQAIERIRVALSQGNQEARQAVFEYLEAKFGSVPPDLAKRVEYAMRSAIAKHKKQPNPHDQYFRRDEKLDFDPVRKPTNKTPANGATGVNNHTALTGNTFGSLYRAAHVATQVQVSGFADMSVLLIDEEAAANVTYQPAQALTPNTKYYWRLRYKSAENYWSDWSDVTSFTTVAGAMSLPAITAPANNATNVPLVTTLTASAFAVTAGADTHLSTDWEVWTGANGTGTRVFNSAKNTANKTSIAIPANALVAGTNYYPRVRYHGTQLGTTGWSSTVKFTTAGAGVNTPAIIDPINNAVGQSPVLTLKSSVFATTNTSDTHASSSWEIWSGPDGTGTLIWNTYNNWQYKTSITVNEGALQPSVKYHARVRHHGTNVPNSSWSPSVAFTIRAAAPAKGTILDTRCEVYDRYNLVADGEYGSEWVLAEANSTSCGFNPARIAAPEWTSADNRTLSDRQGSINSFVNVFRVEYGSDTYVRTEWELYKNGSRTLNGTLAGTNMPVNLAGTSQLANHSVYKLRARFIGTNLPASDWSSWLTINAEWPNSPAAGTVLRTFCSGYDKYEERSNGNYGSYNALIESNAGYCGYVVPYVRRPSISAPATGQSYGDYFAANNVNFSNSAFAMDGTNPTGTWAATEYQILKGDGSAVVREFSVQYASYLQSTFASTTLGDLNDNTWYLVRMRHRNSNNLVSLWSDAISMYVNFTDAGTDLGTYCSGTTLMRSRANGKGGTYGEVVQYNSAACGYVNPVTVKNPFPNRTEAHAPSSNESEGLNYMFFSDGRAQLQAATQQSIDEWGTWFTSGTGNDYELSFSATGDVYLLQQSSNGVNFDSSLEQNRWFSMDRSFLLFQNAKPSTASSTVTVNIRKKTDYANTATFSITLKSTNYVGVTPPDIMVSEFCYGTNRWAIFERPDGTQYWDTQERQSINCGWEQQMNYPPAGTLEGVYCKTGTTELWGSVWGSPIGDPMGFTEVRLESNSRSCGGSGG